MNEDYHIVPDIDMDSAKPDNPEGTSNLERFLKETRGVQNVIASTLPLARPRRAPRRGPIITQLGQDAQNLTVDTYRQYKHLLPNPITTATNPTTSTIDISIPPPPPTAPTTPTTTT